MATNAVYKVYDEQTQSWIEYHFTTNASRVTTTSARKFLTASVTVNGNSAGTTGAKVTVGQNDAANIEIDAGHISWFTGSKPTTNYLPTANNIQEALQALDTAAYNAAQATPSAYVKTAFSSNNGNTLTLTLQDDSTVSITNTTYSNLNASSGGVDVSLVTTGEKYTWNNMVPNTRTINGQALSNDLVFTAANLKMSESNQTTIASELSAIRNTAEGKTNSFVASYTMEGASSSEKAGTINQLFYEKRNNDYFDCAYQTTADSRYVLLETKSNGERIKLDLLSDDVKVGDIFYLTENGIADWWLGDKWQSSTGGVPIWHFRFYRVDTVVPTWAAIDGKPNLEVNGQTVAIGSNSVTVPALVTSGGNNGTSTTAARSDHKHSISAFSAVPDATLSVEAKLSAGTQYKITIAGNDLYFKTPSATPDTKNTAGASDTNSKIYLVGATSQGSNPQTYSHDECYVGTDHCLYSNNKKVSTITLFVQSDEPTGTAGDIWIQTA